MKRWTGNFHDLAQSDWTSFNAFKWALLNLWAVFDVVLLPFVHALLFLINKIALAIRNRQGKEQKS